MICIFLSNEILGTQPSKFKFIILRADDVAQVGECLPSNCEALALILAPLPLAGCGGGGPHLEPKHSGC